MTLLNNFCCLIRSRKRWSLLVGARRRHEISEQGGWDWNPITLSSGSLSQFLSRHHVSRSSRRREQIKISTLFFSGATKSSDRAAGRLQVLKCTHLQMNGHLLHRSTHLSRVHFSRYLLSSLRVYKSLGLVRVRHVVSALRARVTLRNRRPLPWVLLYTDDAEGDERNWKRANRTTQTVRIDWTERE